MESNINHLHIVLRTYFADIILKKGQIKNAWTRQVNSFILQSTNLFMDTSKTNRLESYIFTYETYDKQDLLVTNINIYSKNTNNSDIMWVTLSPINS